jgi:flagella basal body P-ring formation protein FlgA
VTGVQTCALPISHIEKKSDGRAFRLKDVKIRGNRIVPLGSKVLTIDDKTASVPKGRVALTIRTSVDDEKSSTIFLSGWVDLYDDVVCAGKDIPRGRQIGKDDISLTPRNIASAPPGLMTSADKVEGTVAKARIGRGAVIRDSMIEAAPAVRKGDVVKIIAKTGLLTVVAQGISKGEGRVGDQVMVENIRSGKNIPARVAGPGAVEAIF